MKTTTDIEAKRFELRNLKKREAELSKELHALFLAHAKTQCPIPIGARVEYAPGKFGQADNIGWSTAFEHDIAADSEVSWTVSGRKFKADGTQGARDFKPVGPLSHRVAGYSFTEKGLVEILIGGDGVVEEEPEGQDMLDKIFDERKTGE